MKQEPYILTASGIVFEFLNPQPHMFDIKDIAGALSKQCRFGGLCKKFYSVAEHSLLVSEQFESPKMALSALLHDMSEAYLVDIPRPIKKHLKGYYEIEEKIQSIGMDTFGVINEWEDYRETILWEDNSMLAAERIELMPFDPSPIPDWPDHPPANVTINCLNPRDAEYYFLDRYDSLVQRIKHGIKV